MRSQFNRSLVQRSFATLALTAAFAVPAAAADVANGAQARYEQERAVCMNGKSNQDQATCLKEAGAALDQSKKGALADGASADYKKNALARCNAMPEKDRPDCIARIEGDGTTTSGSPSTGGVLRERVTKEPTPAR